MKTTISNWRKKIPQREREKKRKEEHTLCRPNQMSRHKAE